MRCLYRTIPIALLLLCLQTAPASAKLMLITHGSTIKHLGDVETNKGGSVGYYYSYFGIFWIDLWTWDGSYCHYRGKEKENISQEEAARLLGVPASELSKPFWYRYPLGLLILGGIVLISIPFALAERAKAARTRALFEDERYKTALELVGKPHALHAEAMARWEGNARLAREALQPQPPQPIAPAPDAGYEEAILSLVREGIPRDEAETNLNFMLDNLTERQAKTVEELS